MKLSAKVISPLVVFAVALAATAAMISARPSVESNRPVRSIPLVTVMRVSPAPVELRVSAQGTVEPGTESELVTEVSGRIVWVSPELASGGFFSAGDILVRIDSRDYEVALEGARASLDRAKSNLVHASSELTRQRSMRGSGASSRARLDDAIHAQASAEAGLREARVAVRRAELDLERSEMSAPFAGRVREKYVDVGQFVSRGLSVARVYSVDYSEIRLPISDADLAYLDLPLGYRDDASFAPTGDADAGPGQASTRPEVLLSADYAGRPYTWRGHVVRTEGALDARTRMINIVARVDDPYARDGDSSRPPLPVGLFVDASIQGRVVEDVFELPRAALRRGSEVLVIDDDNRVRFRRVEVLRSRGDKTWIRSGLAPGERVVTSSLEIATEGMQVRATEETAPADAAAAFVPGGTEAS